MCGFYDDSTKIKKGDIARYNDAIVTILDCKHIKKNKTMDISFKNKNDQKEVVNIPYMTTGCGFNKYCK